MSLDHDIPVDILPRYYSYSWVGIPIWFGTMYCIRSNAYSVVKYVDGKENIWAISYQSVQSQFNPRLPKGGWLPPPLRIIFRPAKMLNFTIKWVQLIVGSSFPVI